MATIATTNTRYSLTIDKKYKSELEILAAKESRSLNSLMIAALKEYSSKRGL